MQWPRTERIVLFDVDAEVKKNKSFTRLRLVSPQQFDHCDDGYYNVLLGNPCGKISRLPLIKSQI